MLLACVGAAKTMPAVSARASSAHLNGKYEDFFTVGKHGARGGQKNTGWTRKHKGVYENTKGWKNRSRRNKKAGKKRSRKNKKGKKKRAGKTKGQEKQEGRENKRAGKKKRQEKKTRGAAR